MSEYTCEMCPNKAPLQCSKCASVHYCGPQCQLEHWISHKKMCKKLAAERSAGIINSSSKLEGTSPTTASPRAEDAAGKANAGASPSSWQADSDEAQARAEEVNKKANELYLAGNRTNPPDLSSAIAEYERATTIAPNTPKYHGNLAQAHLSHGRSRKDFKQAARSAKKAVQLLREMVAVNPQACSKQQRNAWMAKWTHRRAQALEKGAKYEHALSVLSDPEAFRAAFSSDFEKHFLDLRRDCDLATIPDLEPVTPHSDDQGANLMAMFGANLAGGKWWEGKTQLEAYRWLIDVVRLKCGDAIQWGGGSLVGSSRDDHLDRDCGTNPAFFGPNRYAVKHFRCFIRRCRQKKMLPPWWNDDDAMEAALTYDKSFGGDDDPAISITFEKDDITDKYGGGAAMGMRLFVDEVVGRSLQAGNLYPETSDDEDEMENSEVEAIIATANGKDENDGKDKDDARTVSLLAALVKEYPPEIAEAWVTIQKKVPALVAKAPIEHPLNLAWQGFQGFYSKDSYGVISGCRSRSRKEASSELRNIGTFCSLALENNIMFLAELLVLCYGEGASGLYGDIATKKTADAPHRKTGMDFNERELMQMYGGGGGGGGGQVPPTKATKTVLGVLLDKNAPPKSINWIVQLARYIFHTELVDSIVRLAGDEFATPRITNLDRRLREVVSFAASKSVVIGGPAHPEATIAGEDGWNHISPEFPTIGALYWRLFHGGRCMAHRYDAAFLEITKEEKKELAKDAGEMINNYSLQCCIILGAKLKCTPHDAYLFKKNGLVILNSTGADLASQAMYCHGMAAMMHLPTYFVKVVLPRELLAEYRRSNR